MPDREIAQTAEFLAGHAVLLLGLGVVAAVAALAAIFVAMRTVDRYRIQLRQAYQALVRRVQDATPGQVITRTSRFIPSGYLALHLALGLTVTAAATLFVVIAEEVVGGGELAAFDAAFARALRAAASPAWERFFTAVSWMGSREVLGAATLAVAGVLLLKRSGVLAIGWIAAQAGGGLLNQVLKQGFERTRPEFADPVLAASSWSFPSGHAMGTFILCGLGCYLLVRHLRSWFMAAVVVTLAAVWCLVMGFSRLYLGAHFASDVVAGLFAGAAWVAVCASAMESVRPAAPGR